MNKSKCSGFPKASGTKPGMIGVPASSPTKTPGTPASAPLVGNGTGKANMGSGTKGGKI